MNEPNSDCVFQTLKDNRYVFLTGRSGSGKSYTTLEVAQKAEQEDWKVLLTATTGIVASSLSPTAKTIHSLLRFGICNSIGDYNASVFKFTKMFPDFKNTRRRHLLVIDEISMMSSNTFDLVLYIIEKKLFMYDIRILLVGDFCQLPPVIKDTSEDKILIHNNNFNTKFKHLILTTNKRNDNELFNILLNRIRKCEFNSYDADYISYQSDTFNIENDWRNIKDNTTIILPTRKEVKKVNDYFLSKLDEKLTSIRISPAIRLTDAFFELLPSKLYTEFVDIREDNHKIFDYIGAMNKNDLRDLNSQMKGEIGYFIKNIIKTVKDLYDKFIKQVIIITDTCKIMNNVNRFDPNGNIIISNGVMGYLHIAGEDFFIKTEEHGTHPIYTSRSIIYEKSSSKQQIKLCDILIPSVELSYAITVHKVQGASLENIYFDPTKVFEFGQVYVALSRLKTNGKIYSPMLDYGNYLFRRDDIINFDANLEVNANENDCKDIKLQEQGYNSSVESHSNNLPSIIEDSTEGYFPTTSDEQIQYDNKQLEYDSKNSQEIIDVGEIDELYTQIRQEIEINEDDIPF